MPFGVIPSVSDTPITQSVGGDSGTTQPVISGVDEYLLSRVIQDSLSGGSTGNALLREPKKITESERIPLWGTTLGPGVPYKSSVTITPAVRKSIEDFEGEYAEKVEDPAFQRWLSDRAWSMGWPTLIDSESGLFDYATGARFWSWLGNLVASNPTVAEGTTPEQYADARYAAAGGDQARDDAYAAATKVEEQNPITTLTQRSSTTIPGAVAEAGVDQLARALLGRMASDKELSRYRNTINKFLADNPSVSVTTRDATDPDNVKMTTETQQGASASDAFNVLEQRLSRGSEGRAFSVGKMLETAFLMAGSQEG